MILTAAAGWPVYITNHDWNVEHSDQSLYIQIDT